MRVHVVVPVLIAATGAGLSALMVAAIWRPAGGGLLAGLALTAYGASLARMRAK